MPKNSLSILKMTIKYLKKLLINNILKCKYKFKKKSNVI